MLKAHLHSHMHKQNSGSSAEIAPYEFQPATWSTGAKEGIGSAYYNPNNGHSMSNVWFTLARGVLTEVYYPDVAHANLKSLEFVVSDGLSFTDTESDHMIHHCEIVTTDALIYRQTNTARNGKYRIEKTYITNPHANSVLCNVNFHVQNGNLNDYQLYMYAQPIVSNGANDDAAQVARLDRTYLVAYDAATALAITATIPFCLASVGHIGVSDGMDDLKNQFRIHKTYRSAEHGHVALVGQLDLKTTEPVNANGQMASFTVVIGFGETVKEAITSASRTINRPFHDVASDYSYGWREYLNQLSFPTVGSSLQMRIAAMILKAHEDKLHPGAIVASLSVPWGESVTADEQNIGGYHLIWPRDLYQVASALAAIGDTGTATRALDYLDFELQKADGSFPQNAWLDGTPYWPGLQLDEVAFPILLAGQLRETMQSARYISLVKPAADFIVRNGPQTPQERWEENGGYSPSTIAAEIASLVVAAKMAQQSGDFASAAIYLHTADAWADKIEEWTATKAAKLQNCSNLANPINPPPNRSNLSYIRISDTEDASDGHWIELRNGGGWHPKSGIVDPGFLELVRLGIKPADDELITKSLDIIDKTICCHAPYGPLWYRYNFDGYGENENGDPYPIQGRGVGRPWPILTGERGEYEVALSSLTSKRFVPENLFCPEKLLETMEKSANCGGMIPEQIWDGPSLPERHLVRGMGTGCATPLTWAMAQYLRLGACISSGRIVEMPSVVSERYCSLVVSRRGFEVSVQSPANGDIITDSHLQITGQTRPNATVLFQFHDRVIPVEADFEGNFCGFAELEIPGLQNLTVIAYDNDSAITDCQVSFYFAPPILLEMENPELGSCAQKFIRYPTNEVFKHGDFDLQKLILSADNEYTYFQIQFGHLDNPWNGPSGISKQVVDIYIDTQVEHPENNPMQDELIREDLILMRSNDNKTIRKERSTLGLGAEFPVTLGWTKLIRVTGNWLGDTHVYNSDWSNGGPIQIHAQYETSTIAIRVSNAQLGGPPKHGWMIMIIIAGEHFGGLRPIHATPGEWSFGYSEQNCNMNSEISLDIDSEMNNGKGRALNDTLRCKMSYAKEGGSISSSCIVDLLVPSDESRKRILSSIENGMIQLPMIRV